MAGIAETAENLKNCFKLENALYKKYPNLCQMKKVV